MSEVVARHQPTSWWTAALLACYVPLVTRWVSDWLDLSWYTAAGIVTVVFGSAAWFSVSLTTTALVLTPDAMHLQRRLRPHTIRRDAILAIHGDVPHRPTWSSQVVVDTTDGTITLPGFPEPTLGEIIHRLQDWSGKTEPDHSSPPPPRPTQTDATAKSGDGLDGFDGPIYLSRPDR